MNHGALVHSRRKYIVGLVAYLKGSEEAIQAEGACRGIHLNIYI
jgi:hypothetical protein